MPSPSSKQKEIRSYDEYCNCGAQHGTIDGSFSCTPDCLATYLKAHPEKEQEWEEDIIKDFRHA